MHFIKLADSYFAICITSLYMVCQRVQTKILLMEDQYKLSVARATLGYY